MGRKPTQITHLAHFGRTGVYITPSVQNDPNLRGRDLRGWSRDHKKRLIKEREDKRISQSPSAPEFLQQSIPSQPILHQTLSYG